MKIDQGFVALLDLRRHAMMLRWINLRHIEQMMWKPHREINGIEWLPSMHPDVEVQYARFSHHME
jgi:hypothetical protein